ncbi:MAG: hypothetical protein ACLUKN_08415 [Bacilli bacterium]
MKWGRPLDDNTNLTMENVNIYGCSGCAFVIGGTKNTGSSST